MERINSNLIAPCGMNCGLCRAYLREKNCCPGCNNGPTMFSCVSCKMRNCQSRKGKYCFDCEKFSCDRLKHMDKRYQGKYEMSEIENLKSIRDIGIEKFVENERKKWQTKKGVYCVHDKKFYQ